MIMYYYLKAQIQKHEKERAEEELLNAKHEAVSSLADRSKSDGGCIIYERFLINRKKRVKTNIMFGNDFQ